MLNYPTAVRNKNPQNAGEFTIYVFCVPQARHFEVDVYRCSRCQSYIRLNSPLRAPLLNIRLIT